MTIPRIDLLIKDSRIISLQKQFGPESGIDDDFFIVAMNNANVWLQEALVASLCEPFSGYKDYVLTGSESVDQPTDIFVNDLVYQVFFSKDGVLWSEAPLENAYARGDGSTQGEPEEVFIDGGKIYMSPIPQSGTLRVRYEKRINRLDKRRGTIEEHTITDGVAVSITLVEGTEDSDKLSEVEYVCVVDRKGIIKARNLPVESWDSSTRVLTFFDDHELEDGETITNDTNYIVAGADCSTHSFLPDIAELFYIDYAKNEVYELNSSEDQAESIPKLDAHARKIEQIYDQLPAGRKGVPEQRGEY